MLSCVSPFTPSVLYTWHSRLAIRAGSSLWHLQFVFFFTLYLKIRHSTRHFDLRTSLLTHRSSHVALHISLFICRTSHIALQLSHFTYCSSFVALHISLFICRTSHIALHLSHFAYRSSFLALHISCLCLTSHSPHSLWNRSTSNPSYHS